mgnify:FL=1|jgi:hypothetical protein
MKTINEMIEKLDDQFNKTDGHFELEIKDFLTREMTKAFIQHLTGGSTSDWLMRMGELSDLSILMEENAEHLAFTYKDGELV